MIDHQLTGTEKTVVPAADAMPADKYDFAPTQGEFKGVRTFGAEVKHMAVANYALGAAILGEKPPVDLGGGPNGPANIKSKAEIMKFLTDSFVYAHKAVNSINENNVLEPDQEPVWLLHDNSPCPRLWALPVTPTITTDRWSSTCA